MSKLTIKERGWAGHFICSSRCIYHRNTLITNGNETIVVSSVGNFRPKCGEGPIDTIGAFGRYYETMAFRGFQDGKYVEADIQHRCDIPDDLPCNICADRPEELPHDVDNIADTQHEAIVAAIAKNFDSVYLTGKGLEESEDSQ